MSNVVSINGTPSPENVSRDMWKRPLFKYTFQYRHGDSYFDIDFWALSEADAFEKLDAMRRTMKYVGQSYLSVG